MPTLNDLVATEADLRRAEAEIERLRAALRIGREFLISQTEGHCFILP